MYLFRLFIFLTFHVGDFVCVVIAAVTAAAAAAVVACKVAACCIVAVLCRAYHPAHADASDTAPANIKLIGAAVLVTLNASLAACAVFKYATSSVSLVVAAPVTTGSDAELAGDNSVEQPTTVESMIVRTRIVRAGSVFIETGLIKNRPTVNRGPVLTF